MTRSWQADPPSNSAMYLMHLTSEPGMRSFHCLTFAAGCSVRVGRWIRTRAFPLTLRGMTWSFRSTITIADIVTSLVLSSDTPRFASVTRPLAVSDGQVRVRLR
jgi:hypothetical protein